MVNTIYMYCPYCVSEDLVPYTPFGDGWWKCNECHSIFDNPIIVDMSLKTQPTETE